MSNGTIIITGGNSGLGYETAKTLARKGEHTLVIASRNQQRVEEAITKLQEETGFTDIHGMVLDLADFNSVRQFANDFAQHQFAPLQVLLCNAGLTQTNMTTLENGINTLFAINHLGHFLLANLIIPYLSINGRIIFVSSGTHIPENRLARISGVPKPKYVQAEYLAYPERTPIDVRISNGFQMYSTTKLCNVLCTYELSRQLDYMGRDDISVFAMDPGLMPGTALARELPEWAYRIFTGIVNGIEPMIDGIRQPEISGQHMAYLATDISLNGKTALYFDGDKEVPSSTDSYNLDFARDLWEFSAELVGLQTPKLA